MRCCFGKGAELTELVSNQIIVQMNIHFFTKPNFILKKNKPIEKHLIYLTALFFKQSNLVTM